MNDHADLQTELPDYAAGRLDSEVRPRVEAHLGVCQECRGLVADFHRIGDALQLAGTAMLGSHPPVTQLRRLARSRGRSGDPDVRRHLALCASCALEVEGWKRMGHRAREAFGPSWWMVGVAAAAGLAAGIGLEVLVLNSPPPPPVLSPVAVASAGPQLFLPSVLRGEPGRIAYTLEPGQQTVVMAWPAAIPEEAGPDARFRFEIIGPDGATSWSRQLAAPEIRRHLETTELITLVVPSTALIPGRHEARMTAADESGAEPLYRATVDVRPAGTAP